MITIGIKELKNQLSHYLSFVKEGKDVLVTEHGRVIARIIHENSGEKSIYQSLRPLIRKGLVFLPGRAIKRDIEKPLEISGKSISEIVLENRR